MSYETRRPEIADHEDLDLSNARRIFVFGDLHGRLDLLKAEMDRVSFNGEKGDIAIGLGDWLDRGQEQDGAEMNVLEIRDFINAHPQILWIRGNHEQILEYACFGDTFHGELDRMRGYRTLIKNGGLWILNHILDDDTLEQEILEFSDFLNSAPVAMTIKTPAGRKIGIVHAAVPADSWDKMVSALEGPDPKREEMARHAMWERGAANYAIAAAQEGKRFEDMIVPGIDHVFYGHTIVGKTAITHGNQSWIDTGAYATDKLTFVEIDEWIDNLA